MISKIKNQNKTLCPFGTSPLIPQWRDRLGRLNFKFGFTLIEILVVISITMILAVISLTSFNGSQIKARDSQRKSDLDQISKALMMYFSDNGVFPVAVNFGNVDVGLTGSDGIVYMRQTPQDPKFASGWKSYFYEVSSTQKSFHLFADLENRKDSQCLKSSGDIGKWGPFNSTNYYCYGVASPNTTVGTLL